MILIHGYRDWNLRDLRAKLHGSDASCLSRFRPLKPDTKAVHATPGSLGQREGGGDPRPAEAGLDQQLPRLVLMGVAFAAIERAAPLVRAASAWTEAHSARMGKHGYVQQA